MALDLTSAVQAGQTLFVDTGYFLALGIRRDTWHESATLWARQIQDKQLKLVTTQAVLFEIGAALSKVALRPLASQLLRGIASDPIFEVLDTDALRYSQALDLFEAHTDKDWSLTDCTSFVVMRELGVTHALSADHHFEQAGFVALLK
jgi:predicted nucleic acid-binding protein